MWNDYKHKLNILYIPSVLSFLNMMKNKLYYKLLINK